MSLDSLAHSQLAGFKSGSPHPGPRFCSWCPNTTSSGLPTPHSWGSTGSVPIGGTAGACHWGIAIHQVQCYQRPNVMRWAVRLAFPKHGLSFYGCDIFSWWMVGRWGVNCWVTNRVGLPSGNRTGIQKDPERSKSLPDMIIFGGEAWGLYRSPKKKALSFFLSNVIYTFLRWQDSRFCWIYSHSCWSNPDLFVAFSRVYRTGFIQEWGVPHSCNLDGRRSQSRGIVVPHF